MEIHDEEQLTEYEIKRQRTIIANFEFMKSCGLPVKPLVYVKNRRPDDLASNNEEKKNESSPLEKGHNPPSENGMSRPSVEEKNKKSVGEARKQASKDQQSNTEEKQQNNAWQTRRKIDPIQKRMNLKSNSSASISNEKDNTKNTEEKECPTKKSGVDYTDPNVPVDDHHSFCAECDVCNGGGCLMHAPLLSVEDANVTNDTMKETKARASLPNGLEIKTSSIPDAGRGVFANVEIEPGVRFGPYHEEKIHKDSAHDGRDTSYMWTKSIGETMKQASKDQQSNTEEKQENNAWQTRRKIYLIQKRTNLKSNSSARESNAKDNTKNTEEKECPTKMSRVDYTHPNVPVDDHHSFCAECDVCNGRGCLIHAPLVPVEDANVTNDAMTETKARASLPNGLEIKTSSIPDAGLGVFANVEIEPGVRFGPYQGEKIHKDSAHDGRDTSYMWTIMKDGDVCHYIDGKDESIGNWLRFINCARTKAEQNLVAYQYDNDIFCRVCKNIPVGQEFLVWYSDEYAPDFRIDDAANTKKEFSIKLARDKVKKCELCGIYFHANTSQFHIQYCRGRKNIIESKTKKKTQSHIGHGRGRKNIIESKTKKNMQSHIRYCRGSKNIIRSKPKKTMDKHGNVNAKKKHILRDTDGQRSSDSGSLEAHPICQKVDFYSCDICQKIFTSSRYLRAHRRCHKEDDMFSCDVCEKRFNQSGSLKTHQLIYMGEKTYSCDICGQRFHRSSDLKRHIKFHPTY